MSCTLAALCMLSVVHVVDGDTWDAADGMRYRLWGVDAPERGQQGHGEARDLLEALTTGPLTCRLAQVARTHGRPVVQCWTGEGLDLGCALAGAGLARDMPEFSGGLYRRCLP